MRQIILDTETTGLKPQEGHRLVEIGAVEIVNHLPTGKVYHTYLNPERSMPMEAFKVHGLSTTFLKDFPLFSEVCEDFLAYIGDSPLVIHNAPFDMKFINAELTQVGRAALPFSRCIDTLRLAKVQFPSAPVSLDALCQRFKIDRSSREKHGALVDAHLLVEVYLALIGKRQPVLDLASPSLSDGLREMPSPQALHRPIRAPRPHQPTEAELTQHLQFMEKIRKKAG